MPRDGGLDEQEAGIMAKVRQLANVYNSFHSMISTKLDQHNWSESNPGMWAIVASVERMRADMNG